MTPRQLFVLTVLGICVLASALAVVKAKFESRQLFVELQALRHAEDLAGIEWGQLQLELGALGSHGRVEQLARDRLQMRLPEPDEVVAVEQ